MVYITWPTTESECGGTQNFKRYRYLFSGTKYFPYWYFFQYQFFPNTVPRLFRYQCLPIPVPLPPNICEIPITATYLVPVPIKNLINQGFLPNFSDTGSDTTKKGKVPSTRNSRYRYATLCSPPQPSAAWHQQQQTHFTEYSSIHISWPTSVPPP